MVRGLERCPIFRRRSARLLRPGRGAGRGDGPYRVCLGPHPESRQAKQKRTLGSNVP